MSRRKLPGRIFAITTVATRQAAPVSTNSVAAPRPAACRATMITVAATMKAAFSTLLPAMTRARSSSPDVAWIQANTGTIRRPPAVARPTRSKAARRPPGAWKKVSQVTLFGGGAAPNSISPRSSPKTPIRTEPIGASDRMMRPRETRAASSEPKAMPTTKQARNSVVTLSSPPTFSFTSVGSSDRTMMPTAQNQLTTSAPRKSFGCA